MIPIIIILFVLICVFNTIWDAVAVGVRIQGVGQEVSSYGPIPSGGGTIVEEAENEENGGESGSQFTGAGESTHEAGGEDGEYGDNEDDGNGQHLTGAGVLTYNLTTNYLDQGFVALTNITPYGHNESLVDAWGFSSLQIEGEDYPLTSEWLVDHSSVSGVWVFGVSIGWIWVSPAIQNGGDPAVKSDSWWGRVTMTDSLIVEGRCGRCF